MLLIRRPVTEFFRFSALLHTAKVLLALALALALAALAVALVVAGALLVLLLQPAAKEAAATHATANPRLR
jgi:hypothetical protein